MAFNGISGRFVIFQMIFRGLHKLSDELQRLSNALQGIQRAFRLRKLSGEHPEGSVGLQVVSERSRAFQDMSGV